MQKIMLVSSFFLLCFRFKATVNSHVNYAPIHFLATEFKLLY